MSSKGCGGMSALLPQYYNLTMVEMINNGTLSIDGKKSIDYECHMSQRLFQILRLTRVSSLGIATPTP